MTKPIPTNTLRRAPAVWLLPIVIVFALLAGAAVSLRAADAVITFTNIPSVVSNTYDGVITLQINGLTNGVTNVLVQKFLDVNTNGIIDSRDLLVQQFQLTAGGASVFTNAATSAPVTVTNFLPGDMIPAGGQIVAPLNFQNGDFAQTLAAHYLYKISSPSGQFSPVTNLFVVTNSFYSSWVTGNVQNASFLVSPTNIPNAIVLLCDAQSGSLVVQAGTVADNNGNYYLRAPPGSYFLAAAKSNFVADISSSGIILSTNQTNSFPINLTPASTNLPGKIVDAASVSTGLSGLSGMLVSSNDLLSFYFTDTNGNFSAPIIGTNLWQSQVNPFAAAFKGYLTYQGYPFLNITNKVIGITNAFSRATAIFYGVVSNSQAVPLPGVYVYASDNAGHQSFAMSDQNGNYVILAGTNQWSLSILATNNPGLTNASVFSPGYIQATITNVDQAIQQNFTVANAPFNISGTVEDIDGNPIGGIEVYAISTNTPTYQAFSVYTAANGTYSLNVSPDTTWIVGVNSNSLASLGYTNVPATQSVSVSDASIGGINFSILICGEIQVLTTNLPNATLGSYYETNLQAESCHAVTNWSTAYGITLTSLYQRGTNTFPPDTAIYSNSKLIGYTETYFSLGIVIVDGLGTPFTTNCTYANLNGSGNQTIVFNDISATINVSGPIYSTNGIPIQFDGSGLTWTAQPSTQNTTNYTTVLSLSQLSMTLNGQNPQAYTVKSGTLMTGASGSSNTVARALGRLSPLYPGNSLNLASSFPYASSNNAVVWALNKQGTNQYLISANGSQQTNLPPGLVLYPDGTLAGTPTNIFTTNVITYYPPHPKPRIVTNTVVLGTNGTYTFTVAAMDSASDVAVQQLSLILGSLAVPATITTPSDSQAGALLLSSNIFPLQINNIQAGQNYTVLMSTNLLSGSWVPIYSTNAPDTNALLIPDPNATDPARFYRILISP
jgi:hypothetical protein